MVQVHVAKTVYTLTAGQRLEMSAEQLMGRRRGHSDRAVIRMAEELPWLENNVSGLILQVWDADGVAVATVLPGHSVPLVFARNLVRVRGRSRIVATIDNGSPVFENTTSSPSERRMLIAPVKLTHDQRLLLVALAENRLRRGQAHIPHSRDLALRLGWSITRFNRKLDNVCHKFDLLGVEGLHGDRQHLASHRRVQLVDWVVRTGLISRADLALLPPE